MKIIKYILAVLFILSALGGIFTGEILTGLFFFILGVILLPPISEKLKENIKLWQNIAIRYVSYFLIMAMAGANIDKGNVNSVENKLKSDEVIPNEERKSKSNISGVATIDGNGIDIETKEVKKEKPKPQMDNSAFWSEFDPIVKERIHK